MAQFQGQIQAEIQPWNGKQGRTGPLLQAKCGLDVNPALVKVAHLVNTNTGWALDV